MNKLPNTSTPQELQDHLDAHLAQRVEQVRKYSEAHPDDAFTAANRHMLVLSEQTTWNAAANLTVTGFVYWALDLVAALAPPHVVNFKATGGPDWSFAVFTADLAGYFLVDPSTLGGEYSFQMESVGIGLGEVSFDIYDMNGGQVASFFGAVVGVSVSKMSGTGTLTYVQ